MSLKTRALAGLGTAAVALSFAAPAVAAPTPTPTVPPAVAQAATKLPPFPDENATDAEIEAWLTQAAKTMGLPAFPGADATEAEAYAFVNAVVKMFGLPALPAMNASDAEFEAWANKVAKMFGLPALPSMDASEAEWEAWFTKLIGMEGEMPSVPGATPSQPAETAPPAAGPIVQTDRVVTQSSNTTALTATGSVAALIAGAGVVLVARRRRAMR